MPMDETAMKMFEDMNRNLYPQTWTTPPNPNNPMEMQYFYQSVADGKTPLTPETFNWMFSNADMALKSGEFGLLPPNVQAAAMANPQLFAKSLLENRNQANQDLGSIGAEGGFSTYANTQWNPQTGMVTNPADKIKVQDNSFFTPQNMAMLAALGIGGYFAGPAMGLWGDTAAGTGTAGALGGDIALTGAENGLMSSGMGALTAGETASTLGGLSSVPTTLFSSGAGGLTAGELASSLGGLSATELSSLGISPAQGAELAAAASAANTGSGVTDFYNKLKDVTGLTGGQLFSVGSNLLGGYLQNKSATDASQTAADAQLQAAKIAADANRLQLPTYSNMFGTSTSTMDANGRLTNVGVNTAPWLSNIQNQLTGMAGNALTDTNTVRDVGKTAMNLGSGYLTTSPQEQAAKYMAEQQALLAPYRERDMANMLTGEYNRGTYGLGVGATSTGLGAANPRLESLMNAQRMQDLNLAAQSTQGGMDYAKFGTGMTGIGNTLYNESFQPYGTVMNNISNTNDMALSPLKTSLAFGSPATAASAASGNILASGINNAANTMLPANANSPWASVLGGASKMFDNYTTQNANANLPSYDPTKYRVVPVDWKA